MMIINDADKDPDEQEVWGSSICASKILVVNQEQTAITFLVMLWGRGLSPSNYLLIYWPAGLFCSCSFEMVQTSLGLQENK